jgi:hypothetical protein
LGNLANFACSESMYLRKATFAVVLPFNIAKRATFHNTVWVLDIVSSKCRGRFRQNSTSVQHCKLQRSPMYLIVSASCNLPHQMQTNMQC